MDVNLYLMRLLLIMIFTRTVTCAYMCSYLANLSSIRKSLLSLNNLIVKIQSQFTAKKRLILHNQDYQLIF